MNLIRRLLWPLRGKISPARGDEPSSKRIDELLERRSAIARGTDPETGRMWHKLEAELGRDRSPQLSARVL
jgi:hypothetical protein